MPSTPERSAAYPYPYVWMQASGGWWGNKPIPCRILRQDGMRVKIVALRPDGVELERNVKREYLRPATSEDCCCPSIPCPVHHPESWEDK